MQTINRLIQKYDSATIFIFVATIVVVVELSLMRFFVPSSVGAEEIGTEILTKKMCTSESLNEMSTELEVWNQQVNILSTGLLSDPSQWQKELVTTHAFGQKIEEESSSKNNTRSKCVSAANYAEKNLSLQSVMTGRTVLANISGNIYKVGDTISMRGGEIVLRIVELGATYAVVQLDSFDQDGDTKRTIYLANNQEVINGGLNP
jgi:hypothetical protein|tara:strand:- start:912 stop:1526 length:615 start_codon:yes stop_codon:yes gene_type:complete